MYMQSRMPKKISVEEKTKIIEELLNKHHKVYDRLAEL